MFKQVILIRKDLEMSKGKVAAQACHASVGAYQEAKDLYPSKVKAWMREGGKKVILWVEDKAELIEIDEEIPDEVPKQGVVDAGHTEVEPGTRTCLGIGPWEEEDLDRYTGHLKTVN